MAKTPLNIPESNFPAEALAVTQQEFPALQGAAGDYGPYLFTWNLSSVADLISPWGRTPMLRDRQLRDFWPTEPYLAGALTNVCFRNAAYDWEIRGPSEKIEQACTDTLEAAIAGDTFGWDAFVKKFSEDLYGQDNGTFVELIRDPSMDAASIFKNERAPVLGIAHLDSNQCQRTGNPNYPVIYTDRAGNRHKMAWYQIIPFSDFPSAIERMNGVGYCAVTRVLRISQIMRSIFIYKDELISGRHYKQIHFVSGVARQEIKDEVKRAAEAADNQGQVRLSEPVILAGLDPEKPVSVARIDLASLPEGFDFDQEMQWYINGLALGFGVDYQEFAPLPGGGIGSANQSTILQRKTSGKGPAMFMKIAKAFKNYGVFPRGYKMIFEDRDEEKELAKATLRKTFQEEMAMAIRNKEFPPRQVKKISIQRGIYTEKDWEGVPDNYGDDLALPGQKIGQTGGNTIAEDAARTQRGAPKENAGARLQKELSEEDAIALESAPRWIKKLFARKEKV